MTEQRLRVLVAKPGLDGHDRGAKTIAYLLKDKGMDVIYTGLHKSVEEIVESSIQEDVDVIGISVLSGAHLSITEKLMKKLQENDAEDIIVAVGGVIPSCDVPKLKSLGVKGVFPGGTEFNRIVNFFKDEVPKYRQDIVS